MTAPALCFALLLAQAQASVHGIVTDDETGRPVTGATVALVDLGRSSITDSAGSYLLTGVSAGPWHIEIQALGYRTQMLHVFVPADGSVPVDVALQPKPIPLEPVEAHGDAIATRVGPQRIDGDADRPGSRSVTAGEVRAHPALAEPDLFEALAGGGVLIEPESPSALHVNGGAADQNLFLLDGIPMLSPFHSSGHFSALSPDAISRVDLHAAVAPVIWDGSLSGVVDIRSEDPARDHLAFRGAATATGVRAAADGPLALGVRFLASGRWGLPGFLLSPAEGSYVTGSFSDGLAKLERDVGGGLLQLLAFRSDNTLRSASVPTREEFVPPQGDASSPRPETSGEPNRFLWESRSYGINWTRALGDQSGLNVSLWRAELAVGSRWSAAPDPLDLSSRRQATGGRILFNLDRSSASSRFGLSLERERTAYAVLPAPTAASSADPAFSLAGHPRVFAAFAEHQRDFSDHFRVSLGLRGTFVSGASPRAAPRLSLSWPITPSLSASVGYARTHQWVQSLRNPESLTDYLFSPSLPIAFGAGGAPLAEADQLIADLRARPARGARTRLQVYWRALRDIALVAPVTGQPFAVDGFSVGEARAWGIAGEVELKRSRYRALMSYGLGTVRYELPGTSYRPHFAIGHSITTALAYYPTAQLALRTAISAGFGRPTTATEGPFEWEACSLIDGGCEAAGSPQRPAGPLGGARLPPYLRIDIGVRKHWHWRLMGRDGLVTGFATLSNILGRRNTLGYAIDPATGEISPLQMRPFTPMSVGLEWSF